MNGSESLPLSCNKDTDKTPAHHGVSILPLNSIVISFFSCMFLYVYLNYCLTFKLTKPVNVSNVYFKAMYLKYYYR